MQAKAHEMDKVSSTADGVAARRTAMGIPYAQVIYSTLLESITDVGEKAELWNVFNPSNVSLVPFFEARYRILDKLLDEVRVGNILEIAAGLTPRGLIWTHNPKYKYVEFDLPKKSEQKRKIVETIIGRYGVGTRANLYIEGGDALDADDFARATSNFDGNGPIVVVNEGFLRYLTHEQKSVYAENVRHALERLGGCWITPDVNIVHPFAQNVSIQGQDARMQAKLGMDVNLNLFESVDDAKTFFESLGFVVSERSYREVFPYLQSPAYLNIPMAKVEKLVGERVAFVMKLRS